MIRRDAPLIIRPARRTAQEPVVPMINVVFLLLIFFLMTAQIAPPDPLDVTLPSGAGADAGAVAPLYLSARDELAYGDLRGAEALRAAVAAGPVQLHADATLDAARLAARLVQLRGLGAGDVALVTTGETRRARP